MGVLSNALSVAPPGSRQVGKTTLARDLQPGKPVHYLDLERPSDLAKLADPEPYLGKTVRHYMDLPEGLYLLRSLPAWSRNTGKRLVKSPKTYWRNSGLLHSLAGLDDIEKVLGHPVCDHSWEGYCIEQIPAFIPQNISASHYRTQAGAEVGLVLEHPNGKIHAIKIKLTLSPKLTPAFLESLKTLGATNATYQIPQWESFPLSSEVEAMGLRTFPGNYRA